MIDPVGRSFAHVMAARGPDLPREFIVLMVWAPKRRGPGQIGGWTGPARVERAPGAACGTAL
jgi:hypothetical protein